MTQSKPPIVKTIRNLPLEQLAPDDFERLSLALLPREGFTDSQHYGAVGSERGRDIIAYRADQLWYIQCKRVKECGPQLLLSEIEKVRDLAEDEPDLRPAGMLFMISCDVSATARDRAGKRCSELGLACEIWGRTDLDTRLAPHTDLIERFFGWPIRPSGIPFQAPPLSPHFVPRPEVSEPLKDWLLAEGTGAPGVLVVSAIHGLGGIGKTTLVAALANSPDVQARFSDGVLWVTLGQEPDVLSLLAGWIHALGDPDFRPSLVENASMHLRTLLHDRACLLVVDDAWQADRVRPFLVGGPGCHLLITTRDASLARKMQARLYDLDVMTEAQALALFEARLGALNGDRPQAARLARELGYLPLALELAAAQLEAGLSWTELLDAFRRGLADLAALELDEATYRNESLRLSFRLSLERLTADDQQAFAWLGVLPEDVRLRPAMASTLWDQSEGDARKRLRRLRDRALLKPIGDDERYTIHDLLHDEARLRLADLIPLAKAHAALLGRYRSLCQDQWHALPDDGYIHEHLTWHMDQAQQPEAIHALLGQETGEGNNAWYEAREALGQTTGYLDDVRRAWRLSEEAFAHRQDPAAIGLQCRYALIASSLSSIALNIPPALLVALVEQGVWTSAQGLAYAYQVPDSVQRAEALASLAPFLSQQQLDDMLSEAWRIQEEGSKARAFAGLGPYLSEPLLREALDTARDMENEKAGAEALVGLAPRLAELGYHQEAREAVQGIKDETTRLEALARLAPFLPQQGLEEMLAEARKIESEESQAQALAGLGPYLSEPLLREALKTAGDMEDEQAQAEALAGLAPRLAELGYHEEARAAATGIGDEAARVEASAKLAPFLPAAQRDKALQAALTATHRIWDDDDRTQALVRLAPHLPESLLSEALAMTRNMHDEDNTARAISGLAPYLPVSLLERALAMTEELGWERSRAEALTGLAPYLPEPLLEEAQVATRRFRDKENRARALAGLALRDPTQHLEAALATAREIGDKQDRAGAMSGLAPHLPGSLLGEALAAVRDMPDEEARAGALAKLAPHLPRPLVEEGLAAAHEMQDPRLRTETLTRLACRRGELADPEKALNIAREVEGEAARAEALARLAPHLPKAAQKVALHEALATVGRILDESGRAGALGQLAPHLPEPQLKEALAIALRIQDKDDRVQALAGLAPHLPVGVKDDALEKAWPDLKGRALPELAPHLPEPQLREALPIARRIRSKPRKAAALAGLATRLGTLGHPQEALEVAREIEDQAARAKALAGLAPHLPEPLLRKALAEAQGFGAKGKWGPALAALLRRLVEFGYPVRALAVVGEIRDQPARTEQLSHLLPYLPETLQAETLQEVLAAMGHTGSDARRGQVLERLAPYLANRAGPELYPVWQETLPLLITRARRDLLAGLGALEPVIAALGGEQAVAETFQAVQDVGRWWP